MEIKNLSQLKKTLASKRRFKVVGHIRPEYIGQIRIPAKIQTNGCYTHIIDPKPDELKLNASNNYSGIWMEYDKASDWEFGEEGCTKYFANSEHSPKNLIFRIMFL